VLTTELCANPAEVCANSTELCANPAQVCANSTELRANPAEVCANSTELCGNPAQVCANSTELCGNPAEVCANLAAVFRNECFAFRDMICARAEPQSEGLKSISAHFIFLRNNVLKEQMKVFSNLCY
jgi:hypothetical protein